MLLSTKFSPAAVTAIKSQHIAATLQLRSHVSAWNSVGLSRPTQTTTSTVQLCTVRVVVSGVLPFCHKRESVLVAQRMPAHCVTDFPVPPFAHSQCAAHIMWLG